jgi:hypothetical protein
MTTNSNTNTNTIIINIPSNDKKKVIHHQPKTFRNTTDLISMKPPIIDNEYSNFGNRLNFQPRRFIRPVNEPVVQTHLQGQNEDINETQNDEQEQEEPILETIKQEQEEEAQPQQQEEAQPQQEEVNLNEIQDRMNERNEYIETALFKKKFPRHKLISLRKDKNNFVWKIKRDVYGNSVTKLYTPEGQRILQKYINNKFIEKRNV